jgi:primosomal protein N' (replication factor Y)
VTCSKRSGKALPPATGLDSGLPGWRTAFRRLRARGLVEDVRLPATPRRADPVTAPRLNDEQQRAVAAINAQPDRCSVPLDGVTGSGKTEVCLAAIAAALARGRQSLVLVPEIALTPQTTRRFRERLGLDIAILHSGLTERERAAAWLSAARGEAKVILGTRSAIFVPLPEPGLIIVDEASFKQQDGFRYHARDLAMVRAKALDVPIVLFGNAVAGKPRECRIEALCAVAFVPPAPAPRPAFTDDHGSAP